MLDQGEGPAPRRGGRHQTCLFPDWDPAIWAEGGLDTHMRPREVWYRKADKTGGRDRVRLGVQHRCVPSELWPGSRSQSTPHLSFPGTWPYDPSYSSRTAGAVIRRPKDPGPQWLRQAMCHSRAGPLRATGRGRSREVPIHLVLFQVGPAQLLSAEPETRSRFQCAVRGRARLLESQPYAWAPRDFSPGPGGHLHRRT